MVAIRMPITNVFGGGDYTAQLLVGSQQAPVNVILDTGSSTLAVKQSAYRSDQDAALRPTSLAQDVTYGTGGWAGPVVTTSLSMGSPGALVTLQGASLAVADAQEPRNFGAADGILGLAYNGLNMGYNLDGYLKANRRDPAVTYPWPFRVGNSSAAITQFLQFLSSMPSTPITPYFTQLEQQNVVANKFAFYTQRSTP